ncbi:MAG TPA: hypothetical protein VFP59_12945 [Candidatus Angelobacter sp.]|nr:hypothetical protein [Candidatus Angelobacter sp.]
MKRVVSVLTLISLFSLAASAASIRGVVRNGTTNKPSAGDVVILRKIAAGLQEVGRTKTNGKGEFSFSVPAGQQPYVLWVQHQEVTYPKVAVPDSPSLQVQVFDASPNVSGITMSEHMMVLQTSAGGDALDVDALFTLDNKSSPRRTKNGQHTFDLYLPDNVKVEEATAQNAGGMELKTPVVPTGEKNKYFFGYPLRPGQTRFHVKYSVPYSGKLSLDPRVTLPTDSLLVVTPASINFSPVDASVYAPRTDPQIPKNVSLYVATAVTPKSKLAFQIEGKGELPREEAGAGRGQSAQAENRPGGGLGVPNQQPDPLRNGQWLVLGVLAVFLTAGAVYVYTAKPQQVLVGANSQKGSKTQSSSLLLEAMKEELFQLESDRVEGKITQEEYENSKAALDKTLQRAVKRQAAAK